MASGEVGINLAAGELGSSTVSGRLRSDAGFGRLTSVNKPSISKARMPYQFTSTSYQVRPWRAVCGAAWWLLCHPSPNVSKATQKLFFEVSPVMNRCDPHMCVAEFTSQVECI